MFSCHLLVVFQVQRQSKYLFQDYLKYQHVMTVKESVMILHLRSYLSIEYSFWREGLIYV